MIIHKKAIQERSAYVKGKWKEKKIKEKQGSASAVAKVVSAPEARRGKKIPEKQAVVGR